MRGPCALLCSFALMAPAASAQVAEGAPVEERPLVPAAAPRAAPGEAPGAEAPSPRQPRAAGEARAVDDEPASAGEAPAPGTEAAQAIRLARAELERLTESLLEAAGVEPQPASDIELNAAPSVLTSDAPPTTELAGEEPMPDLEWLSGIVLPDIHTRFHPLLIRQLQYYRDDPRGRQHIRAWLQRSGRYETMIRAKLREVGVPEDLLFVAMVESGFDPMVVSSANAVGMWQWVEVSAVDYGITRTRWVDERRSPELATEAAARFLKDLYGRLGSWPLSLAAYNMGYGALLRSIRKYNTNDFWLLARLEAGLPYETTIYVAKIMACAIIAHNPERFGLADLKKDPPLAVAYVDVPGGLSLGRLASAAGMTADQLAELNPELLRKRVPPDVKRYSLRIPADRKQRFEKRFPDLGATAEGHAIHVLRFGERLKDVAEMYGTTERKLRAMNDLGENDSVKPGTRLRVPDVEAEPPAPSEPIVVAIPDQVFHYADRRQIFYRVQPGDTCSGIAAFFKVSLDELRSWNTISTDATLHSGMVLQLFAPKSVDLSRAVYLAPDQVRTLVMGSDAFFDYHEAQRDRVRVRYRVRPGDTLSSLADRFDLSVGSIARINRFSSQKTLQADSEIILYVPSKEAAKLAAGAAPARPGAAAREARQAAPN